MPISLICVIWSELICDEWSDLTKKINNDKEKRY
jgi:hypothetical protein